MREAIKRNKIKENGYKFKYYVKKNKNSKLPYFVRDLTSHILIKVFFFA